MSGDRRSRLFSAKNERVDFRGKVWLSMYALWAFYLLYSFIICAVNGEQMMDASGGKKNRPQGKGIYHK
ncbi:MAG: hypothetical protein J0M35_13220 [Candidatus Obscuribacter phosphatis]|uniref:Uncharacterized protein n=1 Tax=Candidatus Obscuribacter phosphatis TaxID=1906157 RepID=A0A8J7PNK4_9BACT|nr:hypothetical protein [Candidatus Obscuribacter phosphatis]